MNKFKYEVVFHNKSEKFLVCGGDSKLHTDDLPVLKIYGSTLEEKSRAYTHMAKLRKDEKIRRKGAYMQVELRLKHRPD